MRAHSTSRSGRRGGTGRTAAAARRSEITQADPSGKAAKAGQPFIVITGLSGSGKSQAIRALEDLGYFCVDNLPSKLSPTLARLSLRGDVQIKSLQPGQRGQISLQDGKRGRGRFHTVGG